MLLLKSELKNLLGLKADSCTCFYLPPLVTRFPKSLDCVVNGCSKSCIQTPNFWVWLTPNESWSGGVCRVLEMWINDPQPRSERELRGCWGSPLSIGLACVPGSWRLISSHRRLLGDRTRDDQSLIETNSLVHGKKGVPDQPLSRVITDVSAAAVKLFNVVSPNQEVYEEKW